MSVVYDCYIHFGPYIDAHQRYTAEYFESIGRTIEDAEELIVPESCVRKAINGFQTQKGGQTGIWFGYA